MLARHWKQSFCVFLLILLSFLERRLSQPVISWILLMISHGIFANIVWLLARHWKWLFVCLFFFCINIYLISEQVSWNQSITLQCLLIYLVQSLELTSLTVSGSLFFFALCTAWQVCFWNRTERQHSVSLYMSLKPNQINTHSSPLRWPHSLCWPWT